MRRFTLSRPDDIDGWRAAARAAARADVAPQDVSWQVEGETGDLFGRGGEDALPAPVLPAFSVPKRFLDLADSVILHRDPQRFGLLYAMLTRLRDRPELIDDEADPLHRRLDLLAKEVRRDMHKMRAFVRFREIDGAYVAWFEPAHHIVRANAGFFVRRFTTMCWSILTPQLTIHWNGETLHEAPGAARGDAPASDPVEDLWKGYYAATFNPARLKIGTMLKEMPRRYWRNMPETALIPQLVAGAQAREADMVDRVVDGNMARSLDALREEAAHCTRCGLYKCATQMVFGEGPADADVMIVGEQPGDQEDLAGRPFVGPAGQMLDRALQQAKIDRARVYVTNAVKHFKFEPRGKRRIHARPSGGEIAACRWWIDQERAIIRPKQVILLGTTAIHSVMGKALTLTSQRGRTLSLPDGGSARATIHPSFLLRTADQGQAEEEFAKFVADLTEAIR